MRQIDSREYLAIIKKIKSSSTFYDVHAHPFEVVYGCDSYHPINKCIGLYSNGRNTRYKKPKVSNIFYGEATQKICFSKSFTKPTAMKEKLSKVYCYTGPAVFNDHMDITGIDHVLLLPVLLPHISSDDQLSDMVKFFKYDERFSFAWTIPAAISNDDIFSYINDVKTKHHILALKINPSLSILDLSTPSGIDRIESILDTCNRLQLPLILHGGNSPLAPTAESKKYCTIPYFEHIDWAISDSPVVFAHACAYDCLASQVGGEILPKLNQMIRKFSNILIDISALKGHVIKLVIENIPVEKILFGSDALYYPQWHILLNLLVALEQNTAKFEDPFIEITSTNPAKYIFK